MPLLTCACAVQGHASLSCMRMTCNSILYKPSMMHCHSGTKTGKPSA